MIDENALRDTLVVLAEIAKSQYRLIAGMGTQLQALQETVKGLDPTFSEVMDVRWEEEADAVSAIGLPVLEVFDSLIQRLKDGKVC